MKRVQSTIGRRLGKQDRRQLRALYQDDAVVVLNKPAKMLAVPADDSDLPSALSLLSEELNSKRQRAFVVHRIDRLTSGILLFAKPGQTEKQSFNSLSDTPRCGNISQQFAVISPWKKGHSFITFGK